MAFPSITGIDMTGDCHDCCDDGTCSYNLLDAGETLEVVVPGDCFDGTYTVFQEDTGASSHQYHLLPYPDEWQDIGDVWVTITTNEAGTRYCARVILYGQYGHAIYQLFPSVSVPFSLQTLTFISDTGPCDQVEVGPGEFEFTEWPATVTLGP